MPINVVSKHLPRVARHLRENGGENLLELAYKAEAIRLFATRIDQHTHGLSSPPDIFDFGMSIPVEEGRRYWRAMSIAIDFESLLFHVQTVFDFAWCTFATIYGGRAKTHDSLTRAISDNQLTGLFSENLFASILKREWTFWGSNARYLRNYFTHDRPLGGLSNGWTQNFGGKELTIVLVPDASPHVRGLPKRELVYSEQRRAHDYANELSLRVDTLIVELLDTWAYKPSRLKTPMNKPM